ncbi:MAG TPA: hypothetical protein VIY96_10910 [Thermoanaerobaculia bacterium]
MADRRNSERVLVQPDHIAEITYAANPPGPVAIEKHGERLIVPPETLDRVSMDDSRNRRDTEDRTEPIRLSFLALLAERDPLVQARLNLLRQRAAEDELAEEDRPTDPMILTAKFSG